MEEFNEDLFKNVVKYVNDDLTSKGIPDDAAKVIMMEMYSTYVGSDTWDWIQKTKAKYPEIFPWDARYNSLPKEVHEAYWDEIDPDRHLSFEEYCKKHKIEGGGVDGVLASQKTEVIQPLTEKVLLDFFDDLNKMEDNERKEKERQRKIWNKHYGKYKLQFRGQ